MTSPSSPDHAGRTVAGGCHCGAVRYEASGPKTNRTVCHCVDCRRTSGAPVVAWFSVAPHSVRWTHGAPATYRSSPQATRSFCARCGTQLAYQHDALAVVDLTIASLDDAAAISPEDQTFARSALPWMAGVAQLPRYPTVRDAAGIVPSEGVADHAGD